jgi:hypothetical protein
MDSLQNRLLARRPAMGAPRFERPRHRRSRAGLLPARKPRDLAGIRHVQGFSRWSNASGRKALGGAVLIIVGNQGVLGGGDWRYPMRSLAV